jgi:DNA-binding MarR family transcriptional regulator
MMAGLLVTSIASGQLISRFGRYKPFPIVGTAIMTLALVLLATLGVDTPVSTTSLYMVVLGLGLGMVMQVLVLAVQNAVEYEHLGVATSGSTLFRQVGGSIGVSLFGAIFANQLATQLADRLPAGALVPHTATPEIVDRLPGVVRGPFLEAYAAALQPVFLVAAAASVLAFVLTWFLREVPLRKTAQTEGIGESFASPRDDDSFRELQRSLSSLAGRERHWEAYERFAARAGVELTPPQLWLLGRIAEREPVSESALREAFGDGTALVDALRDLRAQGIVDGTEGAISVTAAGTEVRERLHAVRCDWLDELLDGWGPEEHAEIRRMVDELARSYARDLPRPYAAAESATG